MARAGKRLPSVEEVAERFEQWRRNQQGRAAIPDELWLAAAELARRDGVTRTAAALHLDGCKLKRRMLAANGVAKGNPAPSFVELLAPQTGAIAQCAMELEGRRGRIRIELRANAADLAGLGRALGELVL
jgi:hypothetical protein